MPARVDLPRSPRRATQAADGEVRGADAAGGRLILVPAKFGRGEKNGKALDNGSATYKVEIPKDGNYRLRARVFWPNGSNNSFFYNWDAEEPVILGNDDEYGKWHWIETKAKQLKAGEHALIVRNREENSLLDCITVVPEKADAAAKGTGP